MIKFLASVPVKNDRLMMQLQNIIQLSVHIPLAPLDNMQVLSIRLACC